MGSRSETALLSSLAGALVPAIIDTGVNLVDTTLQNAAKGHTTSIIARTVSHFYTTTSTPYATPQPFEIRKNAANGCLVVVYGPVSQDGSWAESTSLDFDTTAQHQLTVDVGLHGDPNFYYEGRFVYSSDRSAFRIESVSFRYARTIGEGTAGNRKLALTLSFFDASGSNEKAFAAATIPFGDISTGTDYQGSPYLGTTRATSYSTPWMSLPPLSENLKELLAEANVALANLESTLSTLKSTYVSFVDAESKKANDLTGPASKRAVETFLDGLDGRRVDGVLRNLEEKIERLNEVLLNSSYQTDDTVVDLKLKLDQERRGLQGGDAIEHQRDTRIAILRARTKVGRLQENLKKAIQMRDAVMALKTASGDLRDIESRVDRLAKSVSMFAPFTVQATVVEIGAANPITKFLADVFSSAKPGVGTELKSALDPKTRRALEEAEQTADEARQDEFQTLRKAAALTVLKVRGAEIELRLLKVDASEIDRHNAETKLQTAVFEAVHACQKAARRSAHPSECALYL